MRIRVGLLIVAAANALGSVAAAAQDYPFCMEGGDFGAGDCRYATYQQCLASASGRDAWCAANPFLHPAADQAQPRRSRRRS